MSAPAENVSRVERLIELVDSKLAAVVTVLVCGAIAATLEYATHLAVARLKPPLQFHAGLDATVICLLVMTLVSVIIAAGRARRRQVIREASSLEMPAIAEADVTDRVQVSEPEAIFSFVAEEPPAPLPTVS